MLRIILYVTALICLFGGTILYGGNALGAWDPLPPAPKPPPPVQVERSKERKPAKPKKEANKPAPRLTAAQKTWLGRTNSLCRDSNSEVRQLLSRGQPTTPADVLALFVQLRDLNAELNDRFLSLGAPEGFKRDVAEIRTLFAREERYFDAMYRALKSRDMDTYYSLSDRLIDVALDESAILERLGASACGIDLFGSLT